MAAISPQSDLRLHELYGPKFYENHRRGSLDSASAYLGHLFTWYRPVSVLDAGCGRGIWLKTCADLGVQVLYGLDGPWNSQENMIDERIRFTSVDLNAGFSWCKVDLALSLEVAEHLRPEAAQSFVRSLASASDVILFGAACPGQGGVNHLNERYPSYWGELFCREGFVVFDLFRPRFWGRSDIDPWYRQNSFLYVRRNHSLLGALRERGIRPMEGLAFMDCIHPWLHGRSPQFRDHLADLLPSLWRSFRNRQRQATGGEQT